MLRCRPRPFPAFSVLLVTLLALAACASTQRVSVSTTPTATTPPLSTPTATNPPLLAPTPTTIPAGWAVLDTPLFSLSTPPGWTAKIYPPYAPYPVSPFVPHAPFTTYALLLPTGAASAVRVLALPQVDLTDQDAYCHSASANRSPLIFAGLPMAYTGSAENSLTRSWYFINTRGTAYMLEASDVNADAATQTQDAAILATFRPDIADPLVC